MPSAAFGPADYQVFDVKGFEPRMAQLRTRVRPKLETLGRSLAPTLARSVGAETFAHVARHARRTVNPPEDTWVAFGPDARGYKKHCHFKVAVSRHCVRFLFEVGPEHADKARWAVAWKKNAGNLTPVLRRMKDDVGRRRDGQLVLGRAVAAEDAARWSEAKYREAALTTFRALAPLYRLRV
jgi:uncharacterized protein YktB (UPF0637 family)